MHNSALDQGSTLPTIFRVTRFAIKKQRQLLIICALLLRVMNLWFQRGLVQTIGPDVAQQLQNRSETISTDQLKNIDWGAITPHLPVLALGGIIAIIIYLLIHISIALKIFQTVEGKEMSLQQTIQQAWRKIWPYIWTNIVQVVCLFWLFILLIIPWLIFMVYWYFALYVVIYYGKTDMDALKESKAIIKNRRWKTLGYMFLIGILVAIIVFGIIRAITAWVNIIGNPILTQVVTELSWYIAQLFVVVLLAVFFLRRDKTRVTIHSVQK